MKSKGIRILVSVFFADSAAAVDEASCAHIFHALQSTLQTIDQLSKYAFIVWDHDRTKFSSILFVFFY